MLHDFYPDNTNLFLHPPDFRLEQLKSKWGDGDGTIRRKCPALKSDLLSLPTLGFSFFSSLTGYGVKVTESFLHHDKFQNIITSYDDNHK